MIDEKTKKIFLKKHNNPLLFLLIVGTFSILAFTAIFANIIKSNDTNNRISFATYDSSGSLRLMIDHAKIDSPLTDFPVLIHLGITSGTNSFDTSIVFTALGSDDNRKKISITNAGGTELYTEIEKWNTASKEAWLWVKVPAISASQDTYLYFNYDANRNDNTAMVGDIGSDSAKQVWTNGFVSVHHFEENGNATAGEFKDSTNRTHDGQGGEGIASSVPTKDVGKIGDGQNFDGVDDFISIPDTDDFSITTTCQFTWSTWLNLSAQNFNPTGSYIRWIGKGYSSGNWEWHSVIYDEDTGNQHRLRYYNYGPSGGLGAGDYSTSSFTIDQWRYITGVSTCTDASHGNEWLYVDGIHTGIPQTWETYGFTYANGTAPFRIGNARGIDGNDWFNGKLDEIRISNTSRPESWIKASYYTEGDNLMTYADASTPIPTPTHTLTPSSGLSAYWKLDETIGTIAYDSSENNNTGTVNGATWITGVVGNALDFDGIDDYINSGNGNSLNITGNEMSITAWIYPKSLAERYIVSKFNGDTVTSGYNFLITSGNIYFRLGDGTTRYQFAPFHEMSTNAWYHFVAVYDGSSMRIYKNGVVLPGSTSFTGNIAANSNDVNIGQRVDNSYRWNGSLDEIKIYNRALTKDEILAEYQKGIVPTPTIEILPTDTPTPTPDTINPTILITYPTQDSTVPKRTNITVTANADDNIGVSKVEFYRNNDLICNITVPSEDTTYTCSMYTGNNNKNKVIYKATAFDAAGNYSTSSVTVNVSK